MATLAPPLPVRGVVERLVRGGKGIAGWAKWPDTNDPVNIRVLQDDQIIGEGSAVSFRPDMGSATGYEIQCESKIDLINLATRRVVVQAHRAGHAPTELPIWRKLDIEVSIALIASKLEKFDKEDIGTLFDVMNSAPLIRSQQTEDSELGRAQRLADQNHASTLKTLSEFPKQNASCGPISAITSLNMPVEFVSFDGSAVLGYEGMAFLLGGSNNLLQQYTLDRSSPLISKLADVWAQIILERIHKTRAVGADFLQVLIPEKITVLSHLLPRAIKSPTALWQAVTERADTTPSLATHLFSALPVLASSELRQDSFPCFDTHLTARAARDVFVAICERMRIANPFSQIEFTTDVIQIGDIAERFVRGLQIPEIYHMPDQSFLEMASSGLELIERYDPGRHLGTRFVWRRPNAPINAKVIAFANSFFERGASARGLSWWFARTFTEFHFIWSADMDEDYIRLHSPDWVVCQTIERFMQHPPTV
jgi:hypothetical protein